MLALFLAYLDDENDKKLFEDIYYSHRKQMVVLAKSIMNSDYDAEDVVSSVFLRVVQDYWDVVRGIENETDLRNYLLKATKNTALNCIKLKGKDNVNIDTVSEYNTGNNKELTDNTFIDVICDKIEYDKVIEAINLLNERYRDVLYCHFVIEMTVPETAKYLEQSVDTTKKQLLRGKKMLLSLLNNTGVESNGDEPR